MSAIVNCPVCGSIALETILTRPIMPVMQNVVYDTREAALLAPKAPFQLALCTNCGHLFNSLFDAKLMTYDERYDNLVPSPAFDAYYLQLARHLVDRYNLEKGLVVDVGCGKGRFLEVLLEQAPGVTGIGIDPALEKQGQEGRIQWVRDVFKPGQLDTAPVLLICRHVLEHMPGPVDFLKSIHGALSGLNVPCFFEVPDAGWIIKNKAYWDLCYEHCNYYTESSFSHALRVAGFTLSAHGTGFGGQYAYFYSQSNTESPRLVNKPVSDNTLQTIKDFGSGQTAFIEKTRTFLKASKNKGLGTVVWGMATKGVVFCQLIDPETTLVDYHVDANTRKQGRCLPLTGVKILPPDSLKIADRVFQILVMNKNYRNEIEQQCKDLGLRFELSVMAD